MQHEAGPDASRLILADVLVPVLDRTAVRCWTGQLCGAVRCGPSSTAQHGPASSQPSGHGHGHGQQHGHGQRGHGQHGPARPAPHRRPGRAGQRASGDRSTADDGDGGGVLTDRAEYRTVRYVCRPSPRVQAPPQRTPARTARQRVAMWSSGPRPRGLSGHRRQSPPPMCARPTSSCRKELELSSHEMPGAQRPGSLGQRRVTGILALGPPPPPPPPRAAWPGLAWPGRVGSGRHRRLGRQARPGQSLPPAGDWGSTPFRARLDPEQRAASGERRAASSEQRAASSALPEPCPASAGPVANGPGNPPARVDVDRQIWPCQLTVRALSAPKGQQLGPKRPAPCQMSTRVAQPVPAGASQVARMVPSSCAADPWNEASPLRLFCGHKLLLRRLGLPGAAALLGVPGWCEGSGAAVPKKEKKK